MSLRNRLARWLVGPFVTVPSKGTHVVIYDDGLSVTLKAATFRLKMQHPGAELWENVPLSDYRPTRRGSGRFVGTVDMAR